MSVDRRLLNWGVFLVILGSIPLAVGQGWLTRDTVGRAWELWPLLLIGSGIGLLLAHTRLHFIGGLIVAATLGLMLGGLVSGGFSINGLGCSPGGATGGTTLLERSGTFSGPGSLDLRVNCGSLAIRTGAAGWSVAVSGPDRGRPTLTTSGDGVLVRSPEGGVPFVSGNSTTWNVEIPPTGVNRLGLDLNAVDLRVTLGGAAVGTLDLSGNALGGSRVDLGSATVGHLAVEVNAADVRVALPATGTSGTIAANAATIRLCVPAGVAIRFDMGGSALATDNFSSQGLIKNGSTWLRAGAGAAPPTVDLRLTGSAVTFTLNPGEGCL